MYLVISHKDGGKNDWWWNQGTDWHYFTAHTDNRITIDNFYWLKW